MKDIPAHADIERTSEFGRWLTELRGDRKQAHLAAELTAYLGHDVHPGRISEWETGFKVPSPQQLAGLKAILDPQGPEPPTPVKVRREKMTGPQAADNSQLELLS